MSVTSRNVWCLMGLPSDEVNLETVVTDNDCFLSTPNLNFVMSAQNDEEFYQSVVMSDLSVADGMPLIWVAKLLGIPIQERVAGSALFNRLSEQIDPDKNKIKVFFFGGKEVLQHKRISG